MKLSEDQKSLLKFFDPTQPVTAPKHLKGREQEIKEGLLYLLTGECIIVQGARRIGKTSLVHCLDALCSSQGQHCVYVSFQGVEKHNSSAFVQHLIKKLYSEFDRAKVNLEYGLLASLRELGRFVETEYESNEYIIIFIDEFQVTEGLTSSERCIFYNQLRNVIDERPIHPELRKFVFVISTSQSLSELSTGISSTLASAFPKTFILGSISAKGCRSLIREPFIGITEIENEITDFVAQETNGHPYLIKLLMHSTIIASANRLFSDFTAHNLQAMIRIHAEALTNDLHHVHFEMLKNTLSEFDLQVLYQVNKHKMPDLFDLHRAVSSNNKQIHFATMKKSLDHLENLQILRKENGQFRFANRVYEKWYSRFFEQNFVETVFSRHSKYQENSEAIDVVSILFLSADPTDATRLRLGEEAREIQEKLQLAKLRDLFEVHQRTSLRPADFTQALLDTNPQIVHFSGHGTSDGALCFEDNLGQVHPVEPEALSAAFELFSDQVECVIFNSCYSELQAKAITKHIRYIIGMHQAIGDRAAIAFTIGFYQALGAGRSVEEAYDFGCVQIRLQGIHEHLVPVLVKGNTG